MDDPIWMSAGLVMAIHKRQLAEHGGMKGVRDAGLLETAMSGLRERFANADTMRGVPEIAASYAFGIARDQPFLDGNMRTAYVVCRTFLVLNGFDMTAPFEERYTTFLRLAAGEVTEEELTAWLEVNTRKG